MQLIRLHNQQNIPFVQPKPPIKRKRRDEMTAEELGVTSHDADGNPIYEE